MPWDPKVLDERLLRRDARNYDQIAQNLVNHGSFSTAQYLPYQPDVFHTPGYPFFLAGIYSLFGYKPYIAIFIQLLVGTATVAIVYILGSRIFNESAGFIAAAILSIDYQTIYYTNTILTETLFVLLFVTSILFLWEFISQQRLLYLLLSSIGLGLATLCRPISLYFFVVVILILLIRFRKDLMLFLKYALLLCASYGIILSPWLIRNYQLTGSATVSSSGAFQLLYGHGVYVEMQVNNLTLEEAHRKIDVEVEDKYRVKGFQHPIGESEKSEVYKELFLKKAKEHPLTLLKVHCSGMITMFLAVGSSSFLEVFGINVERIGRIHHESGKGIRNLVSGVFEEGNLVRILFTLFVGTYLITLYFASILGLLKLTLDRSYLKVLLFAGIFLYFVLLSGGVGTPRYRVPLMPFSALLSVPGISYLMHLLKSKKDLILTTG